MRNAHCEQPTGAMHTIAMEKGTIDRRRYLHHPGASRCKCLISAADYLENAVCFTR